MKRTTKRLTLSAQSIRVLSAPEVERIRGGEVTQTTSLLCPTLGCTVAQTSYGCGPVTMNNGCDGTGPDPR